MQTFYRPASKEDVSAILSLCRTIKVTITQRPPFDSRSTLRKDIANPNYRWYIGIDDTLLIAVIRVAVDLNQQLAKLENLLFREHAQHDQHVIGLLNHVIKDLEQGEVPMAVLYGTTRFLTAKQLLLTEHVGFKPLGVFPNARGLEQLRANGLTAYYFSGVLKNKRDKHFTIHPAVTELYQLVATHLDLAPIPAAEVTPPPPPSSPIPELELILAPNFARRRFLKLKEQKRLQIDFYPFQEPNAIITDPDQHIEIFINKIPRHHFATIIIERLDIAVDPTLLYRTASDLIAQEGIDYIEVIVDASDITGIDAFMNAGFLPCLYFPCLKRHENRRRDFVVLGKSYGELLAEEAMVEPIFKPFYGAYQRLKRAFYLDYH